MLKNWLLAIMLMSLFFACKKDESNGECPYRNNTTPAPAAEQQAVQAYLDSMNIDAVKHPTGLYYQILEPGSFPDSVSLCSEIVVKYTGKLSNDSIFDSSEKFTWVPLGTLIEGWKTGLPLIRKGGKIRLFIPPYLAYGPSDVKDNTGKTVIPGNSLLIFDIELLDYDVPN